MDYITLKKLCENEKNYLTSKYFSCYSMFRVKERKANLAIMKSRKEGKHHDNQIFQEC